MLNLNQINQEWTLFLDRDGVLNHDKVGSYIFHPGEFVLYDGAAEAVKKFSSRFARIIVVTNQRGIGKGLMTEQDLADIHHKMLAEIKAAGGRIDAIYYAPSLHSEHPERKPRTGMARKAQTDFPDIDFSRSVMVGNNISDMEFARNAGMHAVFLTTTLPQPAPFHPAIDMVFSSLQAFADALPEPKSA